MREFSGINEAKQRMEQLYHNIVALLLRFAAELAPHRGWTQKSAIDVLIVLSLSERLQDIMVCGSR